MVYVFALASVLFGFGQGSEILVNDDTAGVSAHWDVHAAAVGGGKYLVVWTDARKGDYDQDIYCQYFDSLGNRIGENWVINGDTLSSHIWDYLQTWPAVASNRSGAALVCWQDFRELQARVYYRILDSLGQPIGADRRAGGSPGQSAPRAAAMGRKWVVAWLQDGRPGGTEVWASIVDSAGVAGPSFCVSDNQPGDTCVALALAGGRDRFSIAWIRSRGTRSLVLRGFRGDGTPTGPSHRIGTESPYYPELACLGAGSGLVVWQEDPCFCQDIIAQRFDTLGAPAGTPFAANSPAQNVRFRPNVAAALNGDGFVVVWGDYRTGLPRIYGRRFDGAGDPLGDDFPADSGRPRSEVMTLSLAVHSFGNYGVFWNGGASPGNVDICGLCSHLPVPRLLRVNDDIASAIQDFPSIVMDERGCITAFWHDHRLGWDCPKVFGQRFDADLNRLGANFRVTECPPRNWEAFPWAAANPAGTVVVTWADKRDGDCSIYAQLYDAAGNPRGGNIQVSDTRAVQWASPVVSLNDSGDFVVVWQESLFGCVAPHAQRFDRNGVRQGNSVRISQQGDFGAAWLSDTGDCWVTWNDTARLLVFARHYSSAMVPCDTVLSLRDRSASQGFDPRIVGTPSGTKWVAWCDRRGWDMSIWAQRIAGDGTLDGANFEITDDTIPWDVGFVSVCSNGSDRVYAAWCDLRRYGNFDMWGQVFDTSGSPIEGNFRINEDVMGPGWRGAPPHQWSWQSVAACGENVAFLWLDNRNLRSWDVYIRKGIPGQGHGSEPPTRALPTVMLAPAISRRNGAIRLSLAKIPSGCLLKVYDATGTLRKTVVSSGAGRERWLELDCSGLSAGVYHILLDCGTERVRARFLVVP